MFSSASLRSHRDVYIPPVSEPWSLSDPCILQSQFWGHLGPGPVLGALPRSVFFKILCLNPAPRSGVSGTADGQLLSGCVPGLGSSSRCPSHPSLAQGSPHTS